VKLTNGKGMGKSASACVTAVIVTADILRLIFTRPNECKLLYLVTWCTKSSSSETSKWLTGTDKFTKERCEKYYPLLKHAVLHEITLALTTVFNNSIFIQTSLFIFTNKKNYCHIPCLFTVFLQASRNK